LVAVLLVLVGGGAAYVWYRLGQINRVDVSGIEPTGSGQSQTILIVGSDSRAGLSASQAKMYGTTSQVGGQRSDVILLVRLAPSGAASMLSIPRDTLVTLAGTDQKNRINAAFNNGPSQLVQTIDENFGITVNHYIEVNFSGFEGVVNSVGGICLDFPYPAKDAKSGLNITKAGPQELDGVQALALARSRYYEYYADGAWHYDGSGDLGRIDRQQIFLRVLAKKALSSGLTNPIRANSIISGTVHNLTVDSEFSDGQIVSLALRLRHVSPSSVPSYTLPTTPVDGYGDLGDILLPEFQTDHQVISEFLNPAPPAKSTTATTTTTTATLSPSRVTLSVQNGSGVAGQAGQTGAALKALGFTVSSVGNAASFSHTTSVVEYRPGHEAGAKSVAARVQGAVTTELVPTLTGGNVVLVTGQSFGGITGATSSGSAPSTTAAQSSGASASAAVPNANQPASFDPVPCPS
jgi:LCP family protein required for cell wall assembly